MNRLFLLLVATGCSPPKDETISLTDPNNYTYSARIDIGTLPTAIETDITAHWDTLTTDLQGHPVESCDDIDHLQLVWFQYLDLSQLSEKVICNDIRASDADAAFTQDPEEAEPSDCTASFSETSYVGNPFVTSYYTHTEGVWLAQALTGTKNYRMVTALAPSAKSDVTEFSFENDSSSLVFTPNIHDLTPISVPASALSYTVDWSTLVDGANADGCDPTEVYKADTLWLARYDDLSVSDLEANFFDLELDADSIWTTGAGAVTDANLGDAVAEDGSKFEGFAGGETWLLALRATTLVSPAPVFLTVLNIE